jgi:tetratricopeptide (TPR) repeat protein
LSASPAFHELLDQAVRRYTDRTGTKKLTIAKACGYSPGMLSHMLSGKRRPGSRQAVVALARALELSRAETNRQLAALDYSPLTDAEIGATLIQSRMAEASVDALPQPERDLLTRAVQHDLDVMGAAWQHYIDLRDELHRRNWTEVAGRWDAALAYYRELVASAPRFMAWLELGRAEAAQYQGQIDEAKAAARRGIAAAEVSSNRAAQALLVCRLADVEKLEGHFTSADAHYSEAERILQQQWHPMAEADLQFRDHWRARIQRERGNLRLFMGLGREADVLLRASHGYFVAQGHRYEEARVCHSLGWAAHLLGDWDASLAWRERAIAVGKEISAERGWEDPLRTMQDCLYLGLVLEDRGNYAGAEEQLNLAAAASTPDLPSSEYHELGLVYLSLSRIYRAAWEKRDLALAEWWGRQGVDFYGRMPTKDPLRMAIAHNAYGDLLFETGRLPDAMLEFEQALVWARSSDPPSRYYEAAARVRRCRVLVAEYEAHIGRAPEPTQLGLDLGAFVPGLASMEGAPGDDAGADSFERIAAEVTATEEVCRVSSYWPRLAQLKLVEAKLHLAHQDASAAEEAAFQALSAALYVNRFVLQETWSAIEALSASTHHGALLGMLRQRGLAALEEIGAGAPDANLVSAGRALLAG